VRRVILNERDRCAEWARQRIPHVESWGEWCEAIGLEDDGELLAVVVFNLYSGADIAMHIAAVPGRRWMTREFLRVAFRYPFVQLGCRRVSGYVPASNADALRFDRHLGFVEEGRLREALVTGEDVIVLGMLRNEAERWWR
jgi:RimJ/RimL family protein N-acetyltransferase